MITVAVATRTMDRQARYRSLLPEKDFAIVSALDCPTLVQLAKNRPVDVIVFDIQRPAMPAGDWLDLVDSDPDLKSLPIAWVGRDVPAPVFARMSASTNSEIVPPRPDSQVLTDIIKRLAAAPRLAPGAIGSADQAGWRPAEDIIDNALSVFDQSAEDAPPNIPGDQLQDWLVSELKGSPAGDGKGKPSGGGTEAQTPPPADVPTEESSITLESEEIDTGAFGIMPGKKNGATRPKLVNEKILGITTRPGQRITGPELVEHITQEILAKLASSLADELISRVDDNLVRRMVEERLATPKSDPQHGNPSPAP